MQALLRRYRDLTVLTVVVLSQLVLLGSQIRGEGGIPLLRQWVVTAIAPLAKAFQGTREVTVGSLKEVFVLLNAREDNQRLKQDNDRLKLENQFLKSELGTADRAKALAAFQQRSPSKTLAARLIGSGLGANSKTIFIDRGTGDGVKKGMAVITPDGIVGKVVASYSSLSQVLLVTDGSFATGVLSGKNHLPGTLHGDGSPVVKVDYMPTEAKVEEGEWFYTSGDDRIFPRGLPAGRVMSSTRGRDFREIRLVPSGLERGVDEVLVVIDGVHGVLPDEPGQTPNPPASSEAPALLPAPNKTEPETAESPVRGVMTDADRIVERYRRIGEAQNHHFGSGPAPDFNKPMPQPGAAPVGGPGVSASMTGTPTTAAPAAPSATSTAGAPARIQTTPVPAPAR